MKLFLVLSVMMIAISSVLLAADDSYYYQYDQIVPVTIDSGKVVLELSGYFRMRQ